MEYLALLRDVFDVVEYQDHQLTVIDIDYNFVIDIKKLTKFFDAYDCFAQASEELNELGALAKDYVFRFCA